MADHNITLYDASFYDAQAEQSLRSARNVLPRLFRTYRPSSVIDVGCGVGTWLRAALDLGVGVGLGLDGAYVESDQLVIPPELFLPADLAKPGLVDVVSGRQHPHFDLVICLEVAEHLPFERSASLVDELCRLGDVVLFSAAIPFQHGTGHINEQWAEFWALHFRSRGFRCFDILRNQLWSHTGVDWWYAQNMLLFVKEGSAAFERFPAEAMDGPLSRVHPMIWLSSILYHWRPYRVMARGHEEADLMALVRGWASGDAFPPPLRTVEQARAADSGIRRTFPETRMIVGDPESEISNAESARLAAIRRLTEIEAALAAETAGRLQGQQDYQCALRRLETSAAANTTLRQQVARYTTELARMRVDLEMSREQAHTQSIEVAGLLALRDQLQVQAADRHVLQHRVSAMLSSTSWRITAPMRAMRRLFG